MLGVFTFRSKLAKGQDFIFLQKPGHCAVKKT